jgi:hypothetical protein
MNAPAVDSRASFARIKVIGERASGEAALNTPSASSDTCLAKVFFLRGISFLDRPFGDTDIEARGNKDTRCEALTYQFENSQRKHCHLPSVPIRARKRVQTSNALSQHRPFVGERRLVA